MSDLEGSTQPKFSIIIPFQNVDAVVVTLHSIFSSKHVGACEIILVGDGTGPQLPEIVSAALANGVACRVSYIGMEKSGRIGHLRNLGIDLTTTDWFYFVDSDCVLEPTALSKVLEIITSSPTTRVFRGRNLFLARGIIARLDAQIRDERYSKKPTFAYCPNLIIARSVFEQLGPFDSTRTYGSDGDYARKIKESGIEVKARKDIALRHDCSNSALGVLGRWIRLGEARYHRYRGELVGWSDYFPDRFVLHRGLQFNFAIALLNLLRVVGLFKAWLHDDPSESPP